MTHSTIHTPIRTALLCTAAALSLGLASCKDKSEAAGGSEAVSALDIKGVSGSDIEARFAVEPRTVDTASAEGALGKINLLTEGDGISWGSREGSDGTYTYSDLVIESDEDDTVVRIERLELMGARMEGEDARFDKVVVDDLELTSEAEGVSGTVDAVTLVNPRIESVAFLNGDSDTEELPSADAMAIEGVNFAGKDDGSDVAVELDNLAYAAQSVSGAKDGFFTLSDFAMKGTISEGGSAMPLDISLAGVQVTDMTSLEEMQGMGGAGMGSALSNPYSLPFKQFSLEDFDMLVDGFSVDVNGIQMASEERGDTITVKSAMEPLTVKFASDPTSPELTSFRDAFSKLGYDEMVFTSESDSVVNLKDDTAVSKGGHFTMKDGFRMEIDQDMRGVGAMQAAQTQALRDAGFESAPGADASESEKRAYENAVGQAALSSMGVLEIGELVFRLDDNSITDRVFEMVAEQQGSSSKVLRSQAKSMLAMATMFGGETGVDPEIIQASATAVGEWIDNPGSTLVISMDPDGYVPVTDVPGLDAAAMNFTANVDK